MAKYELHNPDELSRSDWRTLQSVQRDGFSNALANRSPEEVDHLVRWDNPDMFYLSHLYPERDERLNPNQLHTNKRVVIAYDGNEVIGFGYSTHNSSGSSVAIREVKSLSIAKNYLWFREVAVRPDHQRSGVGAHIAQTLLRDALLLQPVAAYTWPTELPHLPPILERAGFQKTDESDKNIFGGVNGTVKQVRYQARTVRKVLSRLAVLG